ncbi:calcium/sodium antiporter [Candidatus Albibeggiatoa sp. nov. NOAA]|uniref:calcium/sodium antiporter n=1 Tax=Candidatus Albibeggiatoa sp. nov. NOAA TaxID=3162724 RepID=UPI0032F2D30D|nr:calcium/sodium antiporter [Thiotrichaceae bacterium]
MDIVTLSLFLLGFLFLVVGADTLVKGASEFATSVGISPLVVGLTIIAFGTSAPELAVSVQSAYAGQPDLTVGNVIGSNILNILMVLGIAAVIAPLTVNTKLVKVDVPLMIGVSVLLYILSMDLMISRLDGIILFAIVAVYTTYLVVQSRRDNSVIAEAELEELEELQKHSQESSVWVKVAYILVGFVLLVLGADWLVKGAVVIAQYFGLSELIIGLTIIAIGTSLPELAATIAASLRGEKDLIIGGAIGSNLFNISMVLGISSMVAPNGIAVSPTALNVDMLIMIAVAVLCLPTFFSGKQLDRWEGVLFLAYYVAYTIYLLLSALNHPQLPLFNQVMLWGVIPATVVLLGVLVWHDHKQA